MTKIKTILTILLLIFFSSGYSQTDEAFRWIGSLDDGTEIYIKIEKVNFNSKDVWIKRVHPFIAKKNKKGKYIKSGGDFSLNFNTFYCEDKTYDFKELLHYSSKGKLLETNDEFEYKYSVRIVPETTMDAIRYAVCE